MSEAPPISNDAKRKFTLSRLFRFRLRTLLIVVTVLGVVVGPELHFQIQQRKAAILLRSLPSTSLAYDYDLEMYDDWKDKFPPIRSTTAEFTRKVFGSDLFNPVIRLFLGDDSETSIRLTSNLRHLKWLQIGGSGGSLTDRKISSLEPLAHCTQLEYLVIGNWLNLSPNGSEGFRGTGKILLPYDIAESDLQTIGRLKQLRVLAIGGPFVTDDSLQHLTDLDSLEYLYLSRTNVSPSGMQQLKRGLPNVKIFELNDPSVDCSAEINSRF